MGVLRIITPKASDGCRRLRILRNKGSHVIRKRCEKGHGLFGKRVDKVKPEGVERLSVYKAVIRMVEKISGKRVADMGHMDPYLVRSSRVQSQADIGKIVVAVVGKRCKVGTGIFAVFKVCLAHDGRAGTLAMGTVMVPSGGRFPQTTARYSRRICRFTIWSERIQALNICFAMIKSPEVSRSSRLMAR